MSKKRNGVEKEMNKKNKTILSTIIFLLLAVVVAADNGVFDNTNYYQNSLYNITDVNTTNILVDTIKMGGDSTNHQITDNSTCIVITGDTSTLNIC